ncbi:hypothetical protein [Bradyrhizobium zhanjiangense]|uniref:Uncharacterized protein n=1 Tax=Bradyrhizobium zhanjiangense TaxID=1325107 RepID=A0A4Q0RY62_9BRAD|nr:hypothetical protein [Bradyrhizobium zhanjiangense]RXH24776.1 hypothetical protein XH94_35890 [Bradyrhizobium zhanjiangense]
MMKQSHSNDDIGPPSSNITDITYRRAEILHQIGETRFKEQLHDGTRISRHHAGRNFYIATLLQGSLFA